MIRMKLLFSRFLFLCQHVRWQVYLLTLLIVFSALIFLILLPAKRLELRSSERLLALARAEPSNPQLVTQRNDFATLFYRQLPTNAQLKEIQAFFFEQAAAKRLDIDTVNYQLEDSQDATFSTYVMQVPVSGTYLEIMGFVRKMLESYPTIALTGIAMSREAVQSNQVDAEIELSVYIKKDQ